MVFPTAVRRTSLTFIIQSMVAKRGRQLDRKRQAKQKRVIATARKKEEDERKKQQALALSPYARLSLDQLRQGGVKASDQVREIRKKVDALDARFFTEVCTSLLKENRYEVARAVSIARMERPDFYDTRMAKYLLQQAASNEDTPFVKKLGVEIVERDIHRDTELSAKDHLRIAANFLDGKEQSKETEQRQVPRDQETDVSTSLDAEGTSADLLEQEAGESSRLSRSYLHVEAEGREIPVEGVEEEPDEIEGAYKYHVGLQADNMRTRRGQRSAEIMDLCRHYQQTSKEMSLGKKKRKQKRDRRQSSPPMPNYSRESAEAASVAEKQKEESRLAMLLETYNKLIRAFGRNRRMSGVFFVMDLMKKSNLFPNEETFEFVSHAVVRSVDFVTSAVSMETLPPPQPEIAFVGRSNVGKSSLVNMLTNRKTLAKISNTPGKTKQFNYFDFNKGGQGGRRFYFVDMPGVGFARVPGAVSDRWTEFMEEYFRDRHTLRVVFHLIDSKTGVLYHDRELMQMVKKTNVEDKYAVVLTKVDKLGKDKVRQTVVEDLLDAFEEYQLPLDTIVIPTSSETRIGRDLLWRHLLAKLNEDGF